MAIIDPVCGMTVDPATARGGAYAHADTTYYFCSPGCRQKFAADPAGWLVSGPKGMKHQPPQAQGPRPKAPESRLQHLNSAVACRLLPVA